MQLRETFAAMGGANLTDEQLVALVLGTGTRGASALDVARSLLGVTEGLRGLREAEPHELAAVRGLGMARAVRLAAALQLGRRALEQHQEHLPCTNPDQAFALLGPALQGLDHEELHGLFVDRRRAPIARRLITRGSHAFTIVDPRQIFRRALKLGASGVILAHNHPSGDPTPSASDRDVTERVARAGRIVGIPLLDHLVVGAGRWRSLAQDGLIPQTTRQETLWTS